MPEEDDIRAEAPWVRGLLCVGFGGPPCRPPCCPKFVAHLHQELLVGEGEDVGDGGRLVVQAKARKQEQQGRRCCTPLLPGAVTETLGRLAHGADEAHDEALPDALAAELTLGKVGNTVSGSFWGRPCGLHSVF